MNMSSIFSLYYKDAIFEIFKNAPVKSDYSIYLKNTYSEQEIVDMYLFFYKALCLMPGKENEIEADNLRDWLDIFWEPSNKDLLRKEVSKYLEGVK